MSPVPPAPGSVHGAVRGDRGCVQLPHRGLPPEARVPAEVRGATGGPVSLPEAKDGFFRVGTRIGHLMYEVCCALLRSGRSRAVMPSSPERGCPACGAGRRG